MAHPSYSYSLPRCIGKITNIRDRGVRASRFTRLAVEQYLMALAEHGAV
jgi:hypothetical protein